MRNIIFTTRFHPNEEVAVQMAELVANRLRQQGRKVEIVDLESLRKGWRKPNWAKAYSQNDKDRGKLLFEAMSAHDGEFFVFHDSPSEGIRKTFDTDGPAIELTRDGYYIVETPAVYVPQEDKKISGNVEGDRMINRYFDQRSDVTHSKESGFLSEQNIEVLAMKILSVVERRENFIKF